MSVEQHIPLKDEFSGDESDIEIDQKQETHKNFLGVANSRKKIKKRSKNFIWKFKWVKVPNSVPNSSPIIIRKWVKIKIEQAESQNDSYNKNEGNRNNQQQAQGEEGGQSSED